MLDILDPTISTAREEIPYVPRPQNLEGLRVAIIDNTRKNADAVLQKLAEKLERTYRMKVEVVVRKHQRAPLADAQLESLKGKVDFVIAGVGD